MPQLSVKVYRDLMGENDKWAARTRDVLAGSGLFMLNIIGSPGCGKTTLLEKTAAALRDRCRFAVLEGDIETTNDAERLAAANITASQLLTSGACHLEARLVHTALVDLPLAELDMVIVENVGNLVCPAEFDIGEHEKIALLSVTEGEDKPLKYPLLFREAGAVLVTKVDLLPHLDFDLDQCIDNVRKINPGAPVLQVSARDGTGVQAWLEYLLARAGGGTQTE
jgi:hydrogenase nickel incorporation protein HypB